MKKITVLLVALVMIFALPLSVQAYDLDGEVTQKLNYLNNNETVAGLTELNLEFNKDFGFDKKLYLNPVFKLSYNEDSEFDDLDLNEKSGENGEYDFLREAYFDLYLENADLRFGKQIVDWGSAFKLNPTDVVNPMDFTAEDPTSTELGVSSVKTDYYFDYQTSLTGVIIGQHRPSPIPEAVENTVNNTAESMIVEDVSNGIVSTLTNQGYTLIEAEQIADKTTPQIVKNNFTVNDPEERKMEGISDIEIALKFTRRNFEGYDISVSYFKGYEDIPMITNDYDEIQKELAPVIESYLAAKKDPGIKPSTKEVSLDFGYKETQSIGFSGRGSLADIGAWTEINYNQNEDNEKKIDFVVGGDYTFENNFYTVAQLFHRSYKDYEINQILEEKGYDKLLRNENYLILHGEIPFRSIHTIKTDVIKDLEGRGYILNPAVELSLGNNHKVDFGVVLASNDKEVENFSTLNMLGKEKAYFEYSWNF